MSTAVKRACDACHRRKVKCDGINPCRNCSSAQLTCTYNAIPQKKGPKGSRAKVISELRETQRATSLSAKVQSRLSGHQSPPGTPSLSPNPGLLSTELVKESIDFFFANMYPIMPIMNRQRLEQQALYMDQSLDTYCLLASLSAFMLLQPGMSMPGGDSLFEHPGASITSSHLLVEETVRVRKGYDYSESPTLNSLCTSYFLFGCCYAMELHDKAWFHLREATTVATIMGMDREEKYMQLDAVDSPRCRRLYWLLFVTERAYALQFGRPLTLPATINLPSIGDDPSDPLSHQLNSYILLVNLFRPFDETFMYLWNKTRRECAPAWLAQLRKQESEMHPHYVQGADAQLTDMRTNQQWLRTVSAHIGMQNGQASHHNSEDLSYQCPDMSRDLVSVTSQFRTHSTELLGVPLVAKLLDITANLADVLAVQPSSGDPFSMLGPQHQLQSLLRLVGIMRSGEHHFLPLLLDKVHHIMPRLANPMLQRVPETMCNIDIFEGFGNAGMAQPPPMADFKAEPFKADPYAQTQRMEDDSGSSNGAPTAMNSPFSGMQVSSPTVMSPGGAMDYSQTMADYNSIPDMINSIGQGPQPNLGQAAGLSQQQAAHQQHGGYQAHGLPATPGMHNQMSHGLHNSISQNMAQSRNVVGMSHASGAGQHGHGHGHGHSHSQSYGQMSQSMINNIIQRQPPQRANSFALPQQQNHLPRTMVGEYQALQRANSESVAANGLGMNSFGNEMDFSGLR